MTSPTDKLTESSQLVVRVAIVANRVFLGAVIFGLLASAVFPSQFAMMLMQPARGTDLRATILGMRWMLLLGVAMAVATDRLLAALAQIVASARAGDPFLSVNARRLQIIGWALLFLQLLDIPGALIARFFPSLSSGSPGVPFSPGGWIAVLMVFVLSRVFAAGSAMRDELEGTV